MSEIKPSRILIAEDSRTQAQELAIILEEYGYQVEIAHDGKQALERAKADPPDLIVSDIIMPVMDGYALCREVKGDESLMNTPFILVTSLSSPHDVFKGLNVKADNFIVKPYDTDLLLSRVKYLITNRHLRESGKLQVGIEIELSGQRHFITAERQQILDLLISTYEQAVSLYDALEQRQRELSRSYDTLNALYGLAEGLNSCRTETEVATSAIERGMNLPGVEAGWIYLLDGDEFRLAASAGEPEALFGGPESDLECACQRRLRDDKLATGANVLECERLSKIESSDGLRFHATVPLTIGGEMCGIFNLVGAEDIKFSEEELKTLSGIGNQIGIALERAHLQENLERQVRKRTEALSNEITERKLAQEKELRANEQLDRVNETLSRILDSTPIATVALDREQKVVTWNRAAERIFGYTTEEVSGAPNPLFEDVEAVDQGNLQAILDGEEVRNWDTACRHKDGSLIDVRISGGALTSRHAELAGQVLTIEDIRDRLQIEQQLRQAQKMEAIGNLTGGIAHDFNNLLTIIIGNVDLATKQVEENPLIKELLDSALGACLRGAELTRQLLAFGRRQTLTPEVIDMNRLVRSMVKLLGRTLGEHIKIQLVEGDDLWPVLIDAAQLDSAIVNLSVNARDAMPNGGLLTIETANILCDASFEETHPGLKPGEYVSISISDTGSGMDEEVVAHVFEPFFTTKEVNKGTGLGLAMVYGFVKQSGGHITVYSEVGVGTTFRLYLPRAQTTPDHSKQDRKPVVERHVANGERILVVEDNTAVRGIAERQLKELGYNVAIAGNGQEAVERLKRDGDFSLVFSDVVMPGEMDGIALAEAIGREWPHIPVLLTSGFPETALSRANPDVRVRIINKPYRTEDLVRGLEELLGSREP
ncbi:response regulator [Marivibrio halodurans]|uniref:histidine kinase n=1 Tax=Marivibrio halodurans TaxID=2039722 RepID=A0A8J7RWT4_9PROT|nr:response regulator [Marivibrio halodurans]MBP5856187.1 response regulator [Marivibrio halodurans]